MSLDAARRRPLQQLFSPYFFLTLALLLECMVFEAAARRQGVPPFLSAKCLILVLDRSAVYGVVSVGMTLVILTGGIDLSVGSLIAFGGVVCAKVVEAGHGNAWAWICLGWFAALLTGAAAGSLSGLLITRFSIPPFIATLAMMSSMRGLGYMIVKGRPVAHLPEEYLYLGRHALAGHVPVDVVVMLIVFILGAFILGQTRFGRHVYAIGGNEESARLSGVPVARVKWCVYMLSSVLAAAGGLIVSSELGSGDPKVGIGDELEVIAAVVVGGTSLAGGRGSIAGTFLGLIIISVLRTGLNWVGVESFTQQVILGAVILAAVLMDRFRRA